MRVSMDGLFPQDCIIENTRQKLDYLITNVLCTIFSKSTTQPPSKLGLRPKKKPLPFPTSSRRNATVENTPTKKFA